jgi:hypothetical protein
MANDTLLKDNVLQEIDAVQNTLQANALLNSLLRTYGGEVTNALRPSDSDVLQTLSFVERLVSSCSHIKQPDSELPTEAMSLIQQAGSLLRVLIAGSFIPEDESGVGHAVQAHTDDIVENSIWAASVCVQKARAMIAY